MKYIYLVNRFHLGNKTDEVIHRLEEASEVLGRDYAVDVCETVEEARAVSEKYKDTEYVITAVGGDGTINYLVNALAGTGNILSFVPYGTGNDFFHTCMETLDDGIHEVDIVRVNDRYYINTICFGVDADIANDERFIHNRLIPRQLRFHAAAFYHFLTHKKGRRLKIRLEGAATGDEGGMAEKTCGAAQHESRTNKKAAG